MRPVDQTTFGVGEGNCFSACVASVLEIPIEAVPNFSVHPDWFARFLDWLAPMGMWALMMPMDVMHQHSYVCPYGLWFALGMSTRGPHWVVYEDGHTRHDPHPSRDGISTVEHALVIIPKDPARIPK